MKKKKKNTAKNLNKGLIAFLVMAVVALNFSLIGSVLANDSDDSNQNLALPLPVKGNFSEPAPVAPLLEVTTPAPAPLAICDHNNDGLRNLSDISEFASCKDTFDANGDGIHDISDVSKYAEMNQDTTFCNTTFICVAQPATPTTGTVVEPLAICDHNNDGLRNLSDISEFASCKDTFDADGNGIHDLNDVSLYASMNQDATFCRDTFKCNTTSIPVAELIMETPGGSNNGGSSSNSVGLNICDHNGDKLRNLSDVALFAEIKDTLNLSQIADYAEHNQDDTWCAANYGPKKAETTAKVLGEKLSNCKIDTDVAGQTEWAEGSLIRGCDMKVYRIENQAKRHIVSLKDLFKYIGQRIYNVTDDIVALF